MKGEAFPIIIKFIISHFSVASVPSLFLGPLFRNGYFLRRFFDFLWGGILFWPSIPDEIGIKYTRASYRGGLV